MTAILGGGIAGLSAAYYALENPKLGVLTLIEASNRLGGWIQTNRSPAGILFEKGPRTLRHSLESSENTLNLIDHLGLGDTIIPIDKKHQAAQNRLIYANNKLHLLPNSFSGYFKIKSPFRRPLITALWNDYRSPKLIKEDESIYEFVERRLGKDIADYIISPMVCGTCAGDAKKISVKALLNQMWEAEQTRGTIFKGLFANIRTKAKEMREKMPMPGDDTVETTSGVSYKRSKTENWALWSLQNGLEELPKRLAEYLSEHEVNINLNERCNNITFKPDGVELDINGKVKKCSRIISSLSAQDLSPLVQRQHPQLASELDAIPSVTVGVINFHFDRDVLPMKAFGMLVPPQEGLPILGVIFDSCIFPQEDSTVLTVMMGGAWFEHYFGQNPTEEHLLSIARDNLRTILNIKDDPVEVDVSILKNCIPQHIVGHKQRINRIQDYISSHGIPLSLCGSSYLGVGIHDVILSAKNAIDDISRHKDECDDRVQKCARI